MSVTRDFLASTASALVAGAGAARLRAQVPPVPPPISRFQDLRSGVGLFTPQGGTIGYLVNDGGAVAVDSQYPRTAPMFLAGLRERTPRRDYLTTCMDTARKAITAGPSKDELQKMTVLAGFEDTAVLNARLTLGFVLGQCADELAEKK